MKELNDDGKGKDVGVGNAAVNPSADLDDDDKATLQQSTFLLEDTTEGVLPGKGAAETEVDQVKDVTVESSPTIGNEYETLSDTEQQGSKLSSQEKAAAAATTTTEYLVHGAIDSRGIGGTDGDDAVVVPMISARRVMDSYDCNSSDGRFRVNLDVVEHDSVALNEELVGLPPPMPQQPPTENGTRKKHASSTGNQTGIGRRPSLKLLAALLFLTVLAVIAIVLGMHFASKSPTFASNTSANEPSTSSPSSLHLPYFTSTDELYRAVDEYLAAGGGGGDSDGGSDGTDTATSNARNSAVALRYGFPIGAWDVSRLTNFSRVFDPNRTLDWNVNRIYYTTNSDSSSSTSSSSSNSSLSRAASFNEDLSGWNVSSATTLHGMFAYAAQFNGNLSTWNTSSVTNMSQMFAEATRFAGHGLASWDVSRVVSTNGMFYNANYFVGNLSVWNVSLVQTMRFMFFNAPLWNGDVSLWDTANVEDMSGTFAECPKFNSDISRWNVSKVTSMRRMFDNAFAFNADLSMWDVGRVTNMERMLAEATAFSGIGGLDRWNVEKVTNMSNTFAECPQFTSNLSLWNTSRVTSMARLFAGCTAFESDLSLWNMERVQDMAYMFARTSSKFTTSNLSLWNVSSVQDM